MVHAAEGTLQAYLDGEIDDAAEAAVRDHVAGCVACAGELEALRRAHGLTREALSLLEPEPAGAMLRARARLAQEHRGRGRGLLRISAGSLAKAAMLMLVLAGAAAAAIPDVRRALETTFARVIDLFGGSQEPAVVQVPPPEAAGEAVVPEESATYVSPSDGRIRIILHAPTGELDIVVRLIEADRASVETALTSGEVRLRSGSGRLELMGLGAGAVTIGIPRAVPNATVEVDGVVSVYKEDGTLHGSGPAASARGSEVRFTTGS